MAPIKHEKNCKTCEHCVLGATRRFKCTALPNNPANWWDGYPEEHWCSVHYTAKKEPIKVTQEK